MLKICDLHIHSKFSGGASKNIDILNLAINSKVKGINIIGTGDCLHPIWINEIHLNLSQLMMNKYSSSRTT